MKKLLLIFLFLFSSFCLDAQVLNDGGNHGLMMITTKKASSEQVEGSPYLTEDYKPGVAVIEGKEPLKVFIRYNVSAEQMELKLKPENEEVYVIPFNQQASFKITDNIFYFDQIKVEEDYITGYFAEYFKGENYRLLGKHKTKLIPGSSAKTGYEKDKPALLKVEEDLYVVDKEGRAKEVKPKNRHLKKIFDTPEVKNFLSENKVKSKEDLIAFVAFLNEQQG